MTGTWINVATIIGGCTIGLLLRSQLKQRFIEMVFQALGLFTLLLGVSMALSIPMDEQTVLIVIGSLILGGLAGEALNLEGRMNRLGDTLKQKLNLGSPRFTEGLATAFLLFCIGPMSTIGAINDGLGIEQATLITKSTLDGVSSIALTAGFGFGIVLTIFPLILLQGGTSLLAQSLQAWLTEATIGPMTIVGGIMLIGLGINILNIKKLRIMNLLPALLLAIGFTLLAEHLF